jgi:hypothetical protein
MRRNQAGTEPSVRIARCCLFETGAAEPARPAAWQKPDLHEKLMKES